jgi:hypothetical protein
LVFSNFSPLCCLFFDLRLLITPFGIFKLPTIQINVHSFILTTQGKFNIAMYMAFSNVFSTRLNILADLSCLSFKLRRLTTPLVSSESSCVSNLRIVCGNTLPTTTWPQMWRNGNASM